MIQQKLTHASAGRLGGIRNFILHGSEGMSHGGGRPRNPTLDELKSARAQALQIKEQEVIRSQRGLRRERALWRLRQESMAGI